MSDAQSTPKPAMPSRTRIYRALVKKELREVMRDGRFWATALVVAGLLVVALSFGFRQARAVNAERTSAQQGADELWRGQGDKNPHVAAHYGTYVFKPVGALPFIDPGIDPFVGVSVKLVAHRRNDMASARAQDATGLARFGGLSVALVLQLLIPLLTIGLGFSAWTAERERGTLRQLASLGLRPRVLVGGKALGITAALSALLVPAVLLGALATSVWHDGGAASAGARTAAMAVAYLGYFVVFVGLTLTVSALARSSRGALIALLGFWVAAALIAPRAASDAAVLLAPTPSQAQIAQAVHESVAKGLPEGPPREKRVDAITAGLLDERGFKGAEMFMDAALLSSIELQAEALFENEVIDYHHERLADAIERQESVAQAAAVLSPVVAIRSLSMAFAGTDYAHHRYFADAAEKHRRDLVEMLNRELGQKGGADGWSYKAGRELWERAPAFHHTPPDMAWVVRKQMVSLVALAAWLLFGVIAAWLGARRIRVV
jgi:ABC-2 type transport system permease protein